MPIRALEFGFRETGSAVPFCVSLLILHTQAELYVYHDLRTTCSRLGTCQDDCPSCSWPAKLGKILFSLPRLRLRIGSRETGAAVPSRFTTLIHHNQTESCVYPWASLHPPLYFRDGIHRYRQPTSIGSTSNLSGHAIAYRKNKSPEKAGSLSKVGSTPTENFPQHGILFS